MEEEIVVVIPQIEETATAETDIDNGIKTEESIEVSTFSAEDVDLGIEGDKEPEQVIESTDRFNPEEFELESDDDKKEDDKEENEELICGYDLKKLGYDIDLSDPEDKASVESYLKAFSEQGMTEQQVNCVIGLLLEESDKEDKEAEIEKARLEKEEAEQYSHKRVQERLRQELSTEEKRNYKAVYSWVKDIESSGVPKEWITDAMSNPALVKMLHSLYKGAVNTNSVKDIPEPSTKASNVTPQAVKENWTSWLMSQKGTVSREQSKEYISKFLPMIKDSDMAEFQQIFKSIIK